MCHGAAVPAILAAGLFTAMMMSSIRIDSTLGVHPAIQPLPEAPPVTSGSDQHADLLPFIHISDIHVSKFNPGRSARLKEWFSRTLPMLRPSFVLASGDLTDTIHWDTIGARGPLAEEWAEYGQLVANYTTPVAWHDVRGNHDGFNVAHWDDPGLNPYITAASRVAAGALGDVLNHRHYAVDHVDGAGNVYRVVVFDAVVEPAPSRHFFGALSQRDLDELEALLSRSPRPSATVMMGHYPFNSLVGARTSGGEDFQALLAKYHVSASVSGHLHRWAGPLAKMYARHPGGTLELEVDDFKHSNAFRLAAFDGGALSFVDTDTSSWPAVLVTSPVDARFDTPWSPAQTGGLHRVRLVVWSPEPLTYVSVAINRVVVAAYHAGKVSGEALELRADPLPFHGGPFTYAYFAAAAHECKGDPDCLPAVSHPEVQVGGSTLHTAQAGARPGFPNANVNPPGHPPALAAQVFWVDLPPELVAEVTAQDASALPKAAASPAEREAGLRGTLPPGSHTLQVTVVDRRGVRRVTAQPFTMDGSVLSMPHRLSQWFMTTSFKVVLTWVSGAASIVVVYCTLLGTLLLEWALHRGWAGAVEGVDPAATGSQGGGWRRWVTYTLGPYLAVRHGSPVLFWFLLCMGLYIPLGPWMLGPMFNHDHTVMFAWGLLARVNGAYTVLPHLDAPIYITQMLLLCIAPALQVASMAVMPRLTPTPTTPGSPHPPVTTGPAGTVLHVEGGGTLTIVPPGGVGRSGSLGGALLLLPQMLAALALTGPSLVIHGYITTATGITTMYLPFGALLASLYGVVADVCLPGAKTQHTE